MQQNISVSIGLFTEEYDLQYRHVSDIVMKNIYYKLTTSKLIPKFAFQYFKIYALPAFSISHIPQKYIHMYRKSVSTEYTAIIL